MDNDPVKLLQQLGTQNQKARKEFELSLMELKQKENEIGNISASIDTLKNQQGELELEILPLFNSLSDLIGSISKGIKYPVFSSLE